MNRLISPNSFLIFLLIISIHLKSQGQNLIGFTDENAKSQIDLEKIYDSHLKSQNLDQWMKRLSARPHHVGSPYGKENAEFIASLIKSWGYETEIEVYDVLFPTPKARSLEMISPKKYKAILKEPALKEDRTSNQSKEQLPSYNAYSIDGDVTGELVYVNYGIPADYEELKKNIDTSSSGREEANKIINELKICDPAVGSGHFLVSCLNEIIAIKADLKF